MRPLACALGIALAASLPDADARITEKCNSEWESGSLLVTGDSTGLAALARLAALPSLDPVAYEMLWRPALGYVSPYAFDPWVLLTYDWIDDTAQIAREVQASGVLSRYGVTGVTVETNTICFSPPPPPPVVVVTEYHNAATDHYFMSSSAGENAFIDSGGAGPSWSRTGESFTTTIASACYGTLPVFRFYGTANNSHFFTVSPVECGLLRNRDPGWQYESRTNGAFGAAAPVNGACAAGLRPVYRLFNNRAAQRDSNHRHVTRSDLYALMQARGWIGEGVAMCIP